jgi:EF-P beta-lysylation protein EpmB
MHPTWPSADAWQQALRTLITDPAELLELLGLPSTLADAGADGEFRLQVPRSFAARMEPGNRQDPLLLQVLPQQQERVSVAGFGADPLAERVSNPRQGLIHKYRDRVLLIASGGCAINCRYCFRRHFPYQQNQLGPEQWQQVLDYIQTHTELREAILSGGDPLVTPDSRLSRMIEQLATIDHLQRIRIHSRLPIVIPERVTHALVTALAATRLQPVIVLHCNHANEVNDEVRAAIARLRSAGITVLNQAVLLRGINDSVAAQQQLSETLFSSGVLPYYLFVLDPVAGAAHFDVPDAEAQQLVGELQARLPGYLVPRLAREIPGQPSKTLLMPRRPR